MSSPEVERPAEITTPPDLLLTGSAVGIASRMMPDTSWGRFGLKLARRPGLVAERVGAFGRELASIATGTSDRAHVKADKRFSDPAWQGNPLLKRSMQTYLAAVELADHLLAEAALDWRDAERIRFVFDLIMEGLAPSNNPLVSPLAWKAIIDTGGLSVLRGARRFLRDVAAPPRLPSMVEPDAFTVGKDLAVTPGAVVYRNEVFELIQYTPQTEKVWTVPLLMVPPVINKFYILDIAPGRSMVEYFVRQGHQVFAISWRNPAAAQRSWGCDKYGGAIVDALEVLRRVTGSESAHVQASCSGGILAAMTAAHLSAMGEAERIASLTLMVTVLDQGQAGAAAALDATTAKLAVALSARKGYLDGRALAEVFAWLRPTDLVWRYWVNNYLQGRSPAPFDVLFWNADTTRMPAALHRDMVTMGLQNALTEPGAVRMLGSPVDLGTVTADTYVVAGIADHISPWQACYRSARLLGSKELRFVLSSSGHIAALVNPPGNPKASYRAGTVDERDPNRWMTEAETNADSWWHDLSAWWTERGGDQKTAPAELGGAGLTVLAPAPGSYVHER
ncbi:alpha/beta hydrolase [Mycobacterium sp. 852002-51057_SCH5723018]|uniref:PHA/PHB synthase family protein n=1 Tax=Mycobacterium sp. 852002-51057_SCH5723018 TaxID=1834094 RepID=UPI00080092B1|nr:alpha/beta fold hydrolase [Mycobacterium sp. 852002-51057_SCH5723018]OBG28588.1 poly(3-hydroxyalkanoate) polymerase [Mycobacterium sp. 852002-51057_SCH5723018]